MSRLSDTLFQIIIKLKFQGISVGVVHIVRPSCWTTMLSKNASAFTQKKRFGKMDLTHKIVLRSLSSVNWI